MILNKWGFGDMKLGGGYKLAVSTAPTGCCLQTLLL